MENRSSRQFIVRYETETCFDIRNDQGNTHHFHRAQLSGYSYDLASVIIEPGKYKTLTVSFAGPILPSSRHLLITIEDISGEGPFVFRKDL